MVTKNALKAFIIFIVLCVPCMNLKELWMVTQGRGKMEQETTPASLQIWQSLTASLVQVQQHSKHNGS